MIHPTLQLIIGGQCRWREWHESTQEYKPCLGNAHCRIVCQGRKPWPICDHHLAEIISSVLDGTMRFGHMMELVEREDVNGVVNCYKSRDPKDVLPRLIALRCNFDRIINTLREQILDEERPRWPEPKVD